jgi:hypothetical protein
MAMRLAVVVLAVAFVAGCAPSASQTAGHPVPTTSLSSAADADRRASAESDARDHLAEFTPPAGAHQLAGRPAGADALATPPRTDGQTSADATSWWQLSTSQAPADLVGAIAVPAGATAGDSWSAGGPGPGLDRWTMSFDWPNVGHVLVDRQLLVTAARVGEATVLRVDGETTWVPRRPPGSLIPSGVTSIVLTLTRSVLPPATGSPTPSAPITISDPTQLDRVIELVDDAPIEPLGLRPCPYAGGGKLDISFRSASGAEVAHATATIDGCDDIYLQIGGAQTNLSGGRELTNAVITALHLPWPPVQ